MPAPVAPPAPPASPGPPPRFLPDESADALAAKMSQFADDIDLAMAYQDALVRERRHDDAVNVFSARKDAAPQDPATLMLLGRAMGGADGRAMILESLKIRPAFCYGAQALAEIEMANEKWDAAKAAAEMLVGLRGSARDWNFLGLIREVLGDDVGALEAYGKATSFDPGLPAPKINKALLLSSGGKAAEGLALLDKDPAPPRGDVAWQVALALLRKASAMPDKAKDALEGVLDFALRDQRLLLGLVAGGIQVRTYGLSKRAVDEALGVTPKDARFLAAAAILLLEVNNDGDAGKAIDAALHVAPDDARLMFLSGIAEARQEHEDRAIKMFRAAVATDRLNERYALGLALELDRKGSKEALLAYQKAMELDPKDPVPHLALGLLLFGKGKYEEAAERLEEAAKLDPANADIRFYEAIVHGDGLKLYGKALDDLREYKRLGGTDEAALAWLASMDPNAGQPPPK